MNYWSAECCKEPMCGGDRMKDETLPHTLEKNVFVSDTYIQMCMLSVHAKDMCVCVYAYACMDLLMHTNTAEIKTYDLYITLAQA